MEVLGVLLEVLEVLEVLEDLVRTSQGPLKLLRSFCFHSFVLRRHAYRQQGFKGVLKEEEEGSRKSSLFIILIVFIRFPGPGPL